MAKLVHCIGLSVAISTVKCAFFYHGGNSTMTHPCCSEMLDISHLISSRIQSGNFKSFHYPHVNWILQCGIKMLSCGHCSTGWLSLAY